MWVGFDENKIFLRKLVFRKEITCRFYNFYFMINQKRRLYPKEMAKDYG